MKPKNTIHDPQRDLFRVELANIIDPKHPLVVLGEKIDWTVSIERGQDVAC
jgi:hypothetical protein